MLASEIENRWYSLSPRLLDYLACEELLCGSLRLSAALRALRLDKPAAVPIETQSPQRRKVPQSQILPQPVNATKSLVHYGLRSVNKSDDHRAQFRSTRSIRCDDRPSPCRRQSIAKLLKTLTRMVPSCGAPSARRAREMESPSAL